MGIILDSSVVIDAERAGWTPADLMQNIFGQVGDQPAALSAIGYAELAHGIYRAKTEGQRSARQRFVDRLTAELSIYPFTREAAEITAKIGAESIMVGSVIPYADLLIGATALALGYSVLTANARHFQMVTDLDVIAFKRNI